MKKYNKKNGILFDPLKSINSGQVFLWEKNNRSWYGINGKDLLKFTVKERLEINNNDIKEDDKKEVKIEYQSYPYRDNWEKNFFRLDDDYKTLLNTVSKDKIILEIYQKYEGLRVIRQNPFQCIITFICASNTNIKRIRRMLKNLTKKFGNKIFYDGLEFDLFPDAKELSTASINELISCGLGYRAKFVKSVAEDIKSNRLDFEEMKKKSYEFGKSELIKLNGIGNKTADCILLFSFEKLNSFPIDIWIYRSLMENYSWIFDNKENSYSIGKPSNKQYNIISNKVRNYFGEYSGYVQQYLYYNIRETLKREW